MKKAILLIVTILGLFLTQARPAQADGIIIGPLPPCGEDQLCPPIPQPSNQLVVRYHHVTVDIQDQVAVTRVDQVFYNPNDWEVEGTYIFPLPADAAVSNFTLWVDGEPLPGNVLTAEEARQTYQSIVSQLKDPALLEYVGRGAFQASLYPIPAKGERRIQLEYSQVLTAENGLVKYVYPLNTEKFSRLPLNDVNITVNVQAGQPVRAVYSPSHAIDVTHTGEASFTASYSESNVLPDRDFALYYSIGETQALHLLTYRDPGDTQDSDGYFLLMLAPQPDVSAQAIVDKNLLVVLDKSGSMEGEKFQQAQTAVDYILSHLNPGDRFYLSAFSNDVQAFSPELQDAGQADAARTWVSQLSAAGSTDINRALLEAAAAAKDSERPTYLIFLTDGLPTEGIQDGGEIQKNFAQAAPANLHMFTFGVGYDVDTVLLDSLSQDNHGLSTYVQPGQALDEAVSGFYAKISTPVLTNMSLDFGSQSVYDLYPSPLPDLFAGSQVILTGRYRQAGAFDLTLSGQVNGQEQTFSFDGLNFSADDRADSGVLASLPRLWATRKIGYLLNQIRLNGPDQETIDQIVALSVRYGIVTPYTSYLVSESMPLGEEGINAAAEQAYSDLLAAPQETTGMDAVQQAAGVGGMSRADVAPSLAPAEEGGSGEQTIRYAGSHTFILRDGVWIDTAYDPGPDDPHRPALPLGRILRPGPVQPRGSRGPGAGPAGHPGERRPGLSSDRRRSAGRSHRHCRCAHGPAGRRPHANPGRHRPDPGHRAYRPAGR